MENKVSNNSYFGIIFYSSTYCYI
ncbi:hypothetical protein [Neobacillus sp. 3P2-tot-E-2]